MGLNYMSLLTPSKAPFYGIVPGNSSTPIGSVTLPITFGTEQNFRTEYIKFEVADFESSYHAILGRPALAKFMAVPHYVYLLLKMPGNTGVLSLRGDLLKSFECDKEVYDPEWLANPILVQKKNNNEWRMCVDYTDLNKHCPKDPSGYPALIK